MMAWLASLIIVITRHKRFCFESQNPLYELLHTLVVRPFPVDPVTLLADAKFIVVLPRLGLQPVADGFLADRPQRTVAANAARKRRYHLEQIKASQHPHKLAPGVSPAYAVTVSYFTSLE